MDIVIITGGTGLVGTALSKFLVARGFQIIILTRDPKAHRSSSPGITYAAWNIEDQSANEEAFKKARYIIHLAGANVADKAWTEKRKTEILESRTKSSALLIKAMGSIPHNIESVISASAIGWYKTKTSGQSVETESNDGGFLGE